MSNRTDIFFHIDAERVYQDSKWGLAFDDDNTVNDWVAYIAQYAGNAIADDPQTQRKMLLKVATLAVAALEAFERNNGFSKRHYDK